jgi:hypothetical protein
MIKVGSRVKVIKGLAFTGMEGVVESFDFTLPSAVSVLIDGFTNYYFGASELEEIEDEPPYSEEDFEDAKSRGLDLDDWNDYVEYYELGEREEIE